MAEKEEEKDLRIVALQNANVILHARQQIERELVAERERLRITLASIGDAVISTDAAGRVAFLNPVAEVLTGWTQREAAGRPLPEIFHIVNEHTRAEVENPALVSLREGVIVGLANHTILVARDGTERSIDDSAAPMRSESGESIGAVLVFRDVGERKKADEAQARLAAIVESSEDAIISKTLDGVIRTWNAGAERLFGYTAAEAVGQPITIIIPPDRIAEERDIIARLRRGERIEHFETVRIGKGSRRYYISLSVSPLRDAEGTIIGASKVARNVTERKRTRFLAELMSEVQSLTDAAAVLALTARRLAEHLGADRCAYAEIEKQSIFVITGDYSPNVPSIVGRWEVSAFGAACEQAMLENEPYVVYDAYADPRVGPYDIPAYRDTAIRAVICVPLHKGGEFTAAMAVHQTFPRIWTADEVELVKTVVNHCWEALERARVARTLQESEERYRAIVEATPECVMVVDRDGTILQINSAGLRMFEADEIATLGTCAYARISSQHRDRFRQFTEEVCRGSGGTLAFDILGVEGTLRHMETSAVPLPALGEGFVQLAVMRDVSERNRAEAAVRERDERLQLFLGNATDYAVIISDPQDLAVEWLGGAEQITGWRPEEVLGKPVGLIFTAEDRAEKVPEAETAKATAIGRAENTRWHRRKDGSRFFAEGVTVSLRGPAGELRGFGKVFRDATAERRARDDLMKQTERLRLLWEAASVLLTTEEPDVMLRRLFGKIAEHLELDTYLNYMVTDAAESLRLESSLGIPEETARAISQLEFGQAVCGTVALTREGMVVSDVQASGDPKTEIIKQLGIRAYACYPLLADGRVLGTLSFGSRTRTQFDADELDFLRTITHYVTVSYERLRLVRELRLTDRKKDDFIALLAHELRNPLAPIRNGLQILRRSEDKQIRDRSLEMMDRQLSHMVRLIDDLLDISRITRNKMDLRRGRVRLLDVINSAVETARPLIDGAGHHLEVILPSDSVTLDADLTRLAQVFSNLLTNSAKYTEPGGRIRLFAECEAETVKIAVRDNGIGIPAPALATVFDMFSQVDRTMERSSGGLGIGLALVKGLVEMHGGTVTAESEGQKRGSTFTVTLPTVERRTVFLADADTAKERPARLGRRILVVDDNQDSAASMAMMLELLGDEVRTAHDGVEAVEMAEAFRPEVILMDVGMPRLNGFEATRRIREQAWGAEVIVIALTGWGQEADRIQSRSAGCNGHLVKPVELSDFEKLLDDINTPERRTGS